MTKRQVETDVLIIGGGISGLATAWWLSQYGIQVRLWEKQPQVGGKIQTHSNNGFTTEQAASMIMNFRPEVDLFLKHSGLEKFKATRLLDSESKRYLLHQGQLQALPMTIGKMFASPLWSLKGKLRLLLEPFIATSCNRNETVSEFIQRRLGKEFLEKAMEPFIAGTLASDPDLANANYVLPRLTSLEKKYGSLTAGIIAHKILGKRTARITENFSFNGGMSTLCQHLADKIELGIETDVSVSNINSRGKNIWEVQASSSNGDLSCRCRHIVMSTPANIAASITQQNIPELASNLAAIEYAPLAVVHLGLQEKAIQHPLDSAGFLVPRQEKIAINGNLWMSSLFLHRAPQGQVLLSSYIGGSRDPQAIHLSEKESISRVMQALRPILKIKHGNMSEPVMTKVDKHYLGLPIYHGQYHKLRANISRQLAAHPGLHIQANYIDGVSVRDRISAARHQALQIAQSMQHGKSSKVYSLPSYLPTSLSSFS